MPLTDREKHARYREKQKLYPKMHALGSNPVPLYVQAQAGGVTTNERAMGPLISALNDFEQEIGGREVLRNTLVMAERLDPAMKRLLALLSSQQLRRSPLYNLCCKAGVAPGEFFAVLKASMIAKAQVLMLYRVSQTGVEVMNSIIAKAVDHDEQCQRCEGTGELHSGGRGRPKKCSLCGGSGHQKVPGKLEQQKLVLELLGFLKKGGGLTIFQQNQQAVVNSAAPPNPSGSLEALQQVVSDLIYGKPAPSALKAAKKEPPEPETEPSEPENPVSEAPDAPDAHIEVGSDVIEVMSEPSEPSRGD